MGYNYGFLAILSTLSAVSVLGISIVLLLRGQKNASKKTITTRRLGFLTAFFCAGIMLSQAGLFLAPHNLSGVIWWHRSIYFFILLTGPTAVWLTLNLLEYDHAFKKIPLALYLINTIIIFSMTTSSFFDTSIFYENSWIPSPALGPFGLLAFASTLLSYAIMIPLSLSRLLNKDVDKISRKKAGAILRAVVVGMFTVLDFSFYFGYNTIPPTAFLTLGIWAILMIIIDARYHAYDLLPEFYSSSIISSMPSAVFVTDSDGIIRIVNASAIRMTGFSEKQLIGKFIGKIITEDVNDTSHPPNNLNNFRVCDGVMTGKREIPISISISTVYIRKNEPIGTVYLATNMEKIRENLKIIKKQKMDLEKSVAEMKAVQKALVGREMKMVELKKKIDALQEKLDK